MLAKHAAAIATGAFVLAAAALGLTASDHLSVKHTPPVVVIASPAPTEIASPSATAKPTLGPTLPLKPAISATHSGVLK